MIRFNKKHYPELPYDDTHIGIMKIKGGIIGKVFVGIIVLGFSLVAVNAFFQANGLCGCC